MAESQYQSKTMRLTAGNYQRLRACQKRCPLRFSLETLGNCALEHGLSTVERFAASFPNLRIVNPKECQCQRTKKKCKGSDSTAP